ncbi:MAG: response regulator transcription factor [Actinomycetota bacterium]|nr:response regulator transcription factor [Actinomycetota bacterium]
MIRVLVTDDHLLVRQGIRALLEVSDDIEVVGEAENGKQAIQMSSKLNPDIILMDLIMPEVGGVAATEKILEDWPDIKIVVLTSFVDRKAYLKNPLGQEL